MGFHYFFHSKVLKVLFERFFKNMRGETFWTRLVYFLNVHFLVYYELYDVIIVLEK